MACLAGFACAEAAQGQPAHAPVTPAPLGPDEHRVDFTAEQVELAEKEGALSLSGNVVVRSERFQLTGDTVTLSRSSRGVHVDGRGRLSFCNCQSPPITLGFGAADLAPPSDVLLSDATLRIYGVPVFYSPFLWLRAPSRPGVLPPTLAYRGDDGFLVGSGFHWPLAGSPESKTGIDTRVHAYLVRGVRASVDVVASSGMLHAAWDHVSSSGFELVTSFASTSEDEATLAVRAEVFHGPRAVLAQSDLYVAAERVDRARLTIGTAQSAVVGFGFERDSFRGAPLDEPAQLGPGLELGFGTALGRRAEFAALVETRAARSFAGALSESAAEAEVAAHLPVGPILAEVRGRGQTSATISEAGATLLARAEVRSRVAVPLGRAYARGALVHTVEPVLEAALDAVGVDGVDADARLAARFGDTAGARRAAGWAGLDQSLGRGSAAGDLRLAAGFVGKFSTPHAVLAGRARLDAYPVQVQSDVRVLPERGAFELFARVNAGGARTPGISAHVDARGGDVAASRGLFADDFRLPLGLALPGLSGGARVHVPWFAAVDTDIGADADLSDKRLLAISARVHYRHPCRCLSVASWAGRRVGRDGIDVGLGVDLVP